MMENDTPTPASDASEYFRGWYEKNGEKLNKTRKGRYHDDPEYRERVLAQNRDARKRRRQEQLEEKRKERGSRQLRTTNNWKTVATEVDGQAVQLFTIGAAAKIIGCSVQALRLWERKGVIPETPVRYSKGDRLYTLDQIEMLKALLKEQGRLGEHKVRPRPLKSVHRSVVFSTGKTREVELFRIGVLSQRVGRTVVTLEQLEQRGVLPRTPFRASELGYRLYTVGMMDAVKAAFDARVGEVRGEEEWKKFHDEIFETWKNQGVIGARTVARTVPAKSKKDKKKD